MAKMRVYEVANKLGLPPTDLIDVLTNTGLKIGNPFWVVDETDVFQRIAAGAPRRPKSAVPRPAPRPAPTAVPAEQAAAPAAPAPAPAKPAEPATPRQPLPAPAPMVQKYISADAKAKEKAREDKEAAEAAEAAAAAAPPPAPAPAPVQAAAPVDTKAPKKGRRAGKPDEEPAAAAPPAPPKGGKRRKDKKDRDDAYRDPAKAKKEKEKEKEVLPPGAKRYDAIKQKTTQQTRKGQKTTFLKKRGPRGEGAEAPPPVVETKKSIKISGPLTVKELAHEIGVKSSEVIMHLMKDLNLMATLNQPLDVDIIKIVAEHFKMEIQEIGSKEKAVLVDGEIPEEILTPATPENMVPRPPVVTIMGHVDHGKTRLLDTIRHTNVIDTESGGITQHIGAYQINHQGRLITFLDTPGHESFTALRARGAKVTDLAVLVVAADDGVMPQTIEAIDHARDANVPILVALNKIDKPQANPDRVKQQLSEKGLQPEEWGGDTVTVAISAKFNQNIEDLLDMIFLVTDIAEPKADPARKALGTVIEAEMDKGKGPSATVLVQEGTLRVGDFVVAGLTSGRVRSMENDRGERIETAGPSTPVRLYGLDNVPEAGDQMFVLEDEKTVREIVSSRRQKDREEKLRYESRVSLDDLFSRIQDGQISEFKVIIKGDVQGSIEAITQVLSNIKHEEVRVKVIRSDVGEVKETDVMLAAAAGAVILTFHTGVNPAAHAMAAHERVDIRHYDIIYKLIDDVKAAMAGLLAPEYEEVYKGRAEVRQLFASSKIGAIAGCYVEDGEMQTSTVARVLRGGKEVFKGKISSLRRFKDSVKSVATGYECGIVLDHPFAFQEQDKIECFKVVETRRETI